MVKGVCGIPQHYLIDSHHFWNNCRNWHSNYFIVLKGHRDLHFIVLWFCIIFETVFNRFSLFLVWLLTLAWHHTSRSLWPIFHGPVWVFTKVSITLSDNFPLVWMVSLIWLANDIVILLRYRDPYLMIQWYWVISWSSSDGYNSLKVTFQFKCRWRPKYSRVTMTYIS